MVHTHIPFGIMLQGPGGHMNAWKHPSGPADASVNFEFFVNTARKAEAAGIAFAFVADGLYINAQSIPHFLNRFEPISILSALAASTAKIGLVGTVSTSYSDPFTVARQFATIDQISGGRAGWNAVTTPLEGSGRNYSREHPEHELRYEIADEYLDVIKGLWDSWDDDAFVRNRENGRLCRQVEAAHARAQRPLLPRRRPVEYRPLETGAAGRLPGGRVRFRYPACRQTCRCRLYQWRADRGCEGLLQSRSSRARLRKGAGPQRSASIPASGRWSGQRLKRPSRNIRRSATSSPSRKRCSISAASSTIMISAFIRSTKPFRISAIIGKNSFRATTDRIKKTAREKNLTLREVALDSATPRTAFIGTADHIAGEIIRWVEEGAADGFILGFPVIAEGLDDFATYVLPILERRGYFNPVLEGETLRDHLGLDYRESRYAAPAEDVERGKAVGA